MSRAACSLLALLLLLAALAGCGGGGEDPGSTVAGNTAPASTASSDQEQPSQANPHRSSNPTNPPRQHVPLGDPEPGSKAVAPGVPTTKGGDNSIQAYGTEGEEDPREEALANLSAYLDARLAGEWTRACELASAQFREQLKQLIESAKAKGDAEKPQGCPQTLALLTPEKAKAALRKRFQVDELLSFRTEGEYAYLIFKGAEGKAMFIAMANEEGKWRVNVLEPEAFSGPE